MKIILVGKGDSGKTTIQKFLNDNHGLSPAIQYTIHKPRNENDKYHFLNFNIFATLHSHNHFLITDIFLNDYHGISYGSIITYDVIICAPHHMYELKKIPMDFMVVYLTAPDEILHRRLMDRYDDEKSVAERINADNERFVSIDYDLVFDTSKYTSEQIYVNIITYLYK